MREAARGTSSSSGGNASSVRRIHAELKEIASSPSRHWIAAPAADDLFEWQFALRGPRDSDFEGGIFTGRLVLPVNYPLAPPSIMLLTPNGRWEVGKKICLSNSNYHPELWQPAWGIRTMVEALRSHMPLPGDGAIGALDWPSDLRKQLARESLDFVCVGGRKNRELLPELTPEDIQEELGYPPAASASAAAQPPAAEAAPAPAAAALLAAALALAAAATDEAAAVAVAPAAPPPASAVPRAAAAPAPAAAPGDARRRRESAAGARAPRRQQSVLMQILKPPLTKRGWVEFAINIGIFLLLVSFVATLVDVILHPPVLMETYAREDAHPSPEDK